MSTMRVAALNKDGELEPADVELIYLDDFIIDGRCFEIAIHRTPAYEVHHESMDELRIALYQSGWKIAPVIGRGMRPFLKKDVVELGMDDLRRYVGETLKWLLSRHGEKQVIEILQNSLENHPILNE